MFSLDLPSTYEVSMPNWRGGITRLFGWAEDKATTVYDGAVAYIDPVKKRAEALEDSAINTIESGISSTGSAIAYPFKAAWTGLGNAVAGLAGPVKWSIFILIVGLGLYVFLLAAPFLPKPQYGGK